MKGKHHQSLPVIFKAGQKLRIYFDFTSVENRRDAPLWRPAFNHCLDQLRSLNIFTSIASVGDSKDCDIFFTVSEILTDFADGSLIADARFRAHPSKKTYVEIKLDPRVPWAFTPVPWWKFWDKSERVERWLNHELLHALGCSHTTDKKSPMPSIMDEDNWADRRIDIPDWDRAYVRSRYGLPDPNANQL